MWELLEDLTSRMIRKDKYKSEKLDSPVSLSPTSSCSSLSMLKSKRTKEAGTQTTGGGKKWARLKCVCNCVNGRNNCFAMDVDESDLSGRTINDTKSTINLSTSNTSTSLSLSTLHLESVTSISSSLIVSDETISSKTVNSDTSMSGTITSFVSLSDVNVNNSFSDTELFATPPSRSSCLLKRPSISQLTSYTNSSHSNSEIDIPAPPPLPVNLISSHPLTHYPPPPPPLPPFSSPLSAVPSTTCAAAVLENDLVKDVPKPPPLPNLYSTPSCLTTERNEASVKEETAPPSTVSWPPPPPPLPEVAHALQNKKSSVNSDDSSEPEEQTTESSNVLTPKENIEILSRSNSDFNVNDDVTSNTGSFNVNSCNNQFPNGHMTLPSRRVMPVLSVLTQNKYNTLPHPNKKMKTLNWTKIPTQTVGKSLWSNIDVPALPVDYHIMEELFCQKPKELSSSCLSIKKAAGLTKPASMTINLLDNKRSLAVNIFLKQFKSGSSSVINAVTKGFGLSGEKLEALKRLLPELSELNTIKGCQLDTGELGMAEKFYLQLSEISNYKLRVEAMLQKEKCPSCISDLSPQLDKILDGCNYLIENANLKQFLKIVLHLGNYLNAGSYAGNALGFKLNTLPKLLDTRANKPRMTFLHFVVDVALRFDSDMLNFRKKNYYLRELARTPVNAIEDEVNALSNNITDIAKRLQATEDEEMYKQYSDFINEAESNIAQLKSQVSNVKEASMRLAAHFCEDPVLFQLDECCALLADFFEKVDNVINENEELKKQEENSAKLAVVNKLKSVPKRRKSRVSEDKDCVVDVLMKEIRSGTFKLRKTTRHEV